LPGSLTPISANLSLSWSKLNDAGTRELGSTAEKFHFLCLALVLVDESGGIEDAASCSVIEGAMICIDIEHHK